MRFYKNTPDDSHCFQSALLMALSVLLPLKTFTRTEIDHVTGYKRHTATWHNRGLAWLAKKGFAVTRISNFDYSTFAKKGRRYLWDFWDQDTYDWQLLHSDFDAESSIAKETIRDIKNVHRLPTVADIENFLDKGNVVLANINIRLLNGKKGYVNHTVLVVRMTATKVIFHDPGLPPQKNRVAARRRFENSLGEVIAIRRVK